MPQQPGRNPAISPLDPFAPFPAIAVERSIVERFDEQVRRHAQRPAIQTDARCLTFDELNGMANAVANEVLARRGTGAEAIALLFDDRAAIVASILGVLKARKFYVVLDASHPPERLRYLLEDSGATLVVADSANLALARQLSNEATPIVDFAQCTESRSHEDVRIASRPDELVTIIYTSGSTGRPKGVMHTHRTVLADVRNVTNAWGVSPRDRWLWHTSIGFGGSARTIYGALLNGSALHPYDSKRHGLAAFPEWIVNHAITIFRTVPTAFRTFMATLPASMTFPSVRILSMGGEPLYTPDLHFFQRHFSPGSVLVHPFGPTETMLVCWSVTRHGETVTGNTVPIGYPLEDVTVLLLDEAGRQVDDGEI